MLLLVCLEKAASLSVHPSIIHSLLCIQGRVMRRGEADIEKRL